MQDKGYFSMQDNLKVAYMRPEDVTVGTMVIDAVTHDLLEVTSVEKDDEGVVIVVENGLFELRYATQEIARRFIALRVVVAK